MIAVYWILATSVLCLSTHAFVVETPQGDSVTAATAADETSHLLRADSGFVQMLQSMMNQASFIPAVPQIGTAAQFRFQPIQTQMLPQQQFMRTNQGHVFPGQSSQSQPPVFNGQFQQQPHMILPQQPMPAAQPIQPQHHQHQPVSEHISNDIDSDSLSSSAHTLFSTEKCGQVRPMVTKFVAGGDPLDNHEHPWYVQLIIHNSEYTESETYCGGTLISEQWVLTAAHCYDDMRRDRLAKSTHVIFRGLHGINRKYTAKVDFVSMHPNYVPAMLPWEAEAQGLKPGPFNDMALVRLKVHDMPQPIRARLVPVCVPAPHVVVPEGTVCKIMGHGFMNAEDEKNFRMPSKLQAADVRISTNRDCQDDVESKTIKEKINEKTTCVRGRIQPCVGDSGGPLVCTGSSRRNIEGSELDDENLNDERVMSDDFKPRRWYLVGVTSFAVSTDEHDHCGTFKSAVFGVVASQLDWIRSTILKQSTAHQNTQHHHHHHHHHQGNNNFFNNKKM